MGTFETETIDKLFLELAQVTGATTPRELALERKVRVLTSLLKKGMLVAGQDGLNSWQDYAERVMESL